jgi:hypothetical protein
VADQAAGRGGKKLGSDAAADEYPSVAGAGVGAVGGEVAEGGAYEKREMKEVGLLKRFYESGLGELFGIHLFGFWSRGVR